MGLALNKTRCYYMQVLENMNLNIFSPGKAVAAAFEKPNVALALGLVLASAIIWLLQVFLITKQVDAVLAAIAVARSFVSFIVFLPIIFALCFILNRKALKGKFSGLLSALALLQIIQIIVYIISIISFSLVIPANVAAEITSVKGDVFSAAAQITEILNENIGSINMPIYYAFEAITTLFELFGLYICCLSVKKAADSGTIAAILVSLAAFIIIAVLGI